ncbi:MAG TPA: hypothetical protein VF809_02030 [Candidatus Saccharimonadales bacterium]
MYWETPFESSELGEQLFDGVVGADGTEVVFSFISFPEDVDGFGAPDGPMPDVLRPSQLHGNHTQFYDMEGFPDLVVRHNWRRSPDLLPGLRAGLASAEVLSREGGINVLPFEPIEYNGQLYVVTKRVDGITLDRALRAQPEKLHGEVDRVLNGICGSLLTCFLSDEPFPGDVTECHQYMYGTIQGDAEPEVWLVDLPFASTPMTEMGVFETVLGNIVLEAQEMERWSCGRSLPEARAAITRALPLCRDEALRYLPALEQYIRNREAAAPGDADAVVMWRGY